MMPLFETSQSPEINNSQELDEFRQAFRDTKCIIDKVQEAIFVYDQGGRLLETNQTALTLHQLTYEQAIRELSIEELAISGSRWESRSELWQATSQTEKLTFDWRRTSNDGLLVLEMVAQIIVLGGEPCLMICAHEVTKRKQLEEQQRRLLALIEATPDLVGMVDSKGKILYLNQAGREMLEISGTNLEERYIHEIMPAQYTERFASTILPHAIEKGHWSGDATFEMASGQSFPGSQVLVSHKDELGDVQYLSTIIRDVSETKASEAKLRDREQ